MSVERKIPQSSKKERKEERKKGLLVILGMFELFFFYSAFLPHENIYAVCTSGALALSKVDELNYSLEVRLFSFQWKHTADRTSY